MGLILSDEETQDGLVDIDDLHDYRACGGDCPNCQAERAEWREDQATEAALAMAEPEECLFGQNQADERPISMHPAEYARSQRMMDVIDALNNGDTETLWEALEQYR